MNETVIYDILDKLIQVDQHTIEALRITLNILESHQTMMIYVLVCLVCLYILSIISIINNFKINKKLKELDKRIDNHLIK